MLSILFFPFKFAWSFIELAFNILGFLLSLVVGAVVLILGLSLTATFFGAIIGIPLMILGGMLVTKGILR